MAKKLQTTVDKLVPHISAYASVHDDWLSQLKTYYNIKLDSGDIFRLNLYTLGLYIELLISRVDDLEVDIEELEKTVIKSIAEVEAMLAGSKKKKWEKDIYEALVQLIENNREIEEQNNYTIVQTYQYRILDHFKNIPEIVVEAYVKDSVESFENLNVRKYFQ